MKASTAEAPNAGDDSQLICDYTSSILHNPRVLNCNNHELYLVISVSFILEDPRTVNCNNRELYVCCKIYEQQIVTTRVVYGKNPRVANCKIREKNIVQSTSY